MFPTLTRHRPGAGRLVAAALTVATLAGGGLAAGSPATAADPASPQAAPAARAEAAAVAWPVLRAGARGTQVTALQHLLVARGQAIAVDGVFGRATTGAVKAFQRAQRLTADGVVGPATWGKLAPTLRQGARGPAVRAAQTLLRARGQSVPVDGVWAAAMTTKVKAFQRAQRLTADGVIGPRTWAALLGAKPAPAGDRAALARAILNTSGITLATVHPGGRHPGSTAKQNIIDTANGRGALTSPWSDVPNRRVPLDTRMLNGLLKLRTQHGYRIAVSELVGGDHGSTSRHYKGLAIDINYINGRHVGDRGAPHRAVMSACRGLGATEVLGPGDRGHSRHVHCAWPR
ncbi:peptidoglycan-binding domain-containing protein [Streptomyces yaizuensis]|uniref:Peptidoglycan-binding protein n=1 Tax=Streptomyces yaizuensis TaxID=2989713 RepID=A0ABQ5NU97_9ACTN|nr:peptidoglycan-binding protein [Streptomyces sp. YSPA8]GLF93832.1 peptidoglycan-binding protein [Streptomyces sp. YSPA8]